jgi:hypothetical protein
MIAGFMEVPAFVLGTACIALVLWDVFQTIVVPRPSPGWFRIARHLTGWTWRAWRAVSHRLWTGMDADRVLGLYAPASVVLLLAAWLVALVVGYGLVFWAIRDQLHPATPDLATTIYFAGTSVLTLGSGDVLAIGPFARFATLTAAAAGLGVVALVITYLFSLFGSYQRRERAIVTLQAVAGAPPSAVVLLKTHRRLDLVDALPALFASWETWCAEVLDTHVAYPILGYFRSSHDNQSWMSALGAVLDAATLVLTTVRGGPRGQAERMRRGGNHLVEDITNHFSMSWDGNPGVARSEFDDAYRRLGAAGYGLEDEDAAWSAFAAARASYASRLIAMAQYWSTPAASWIADATMPAASLHPEAAPATDVAAIPARRAGEEEPGPG